MTKKKMLVTAAIATAIVLVFLLFVFVFKTVLIFILSRPHNWAAVDVSVDPLAPGTLWATEDGAFSYTTTSEPRTGTLADPPILGTLRTAEQSIEVSLYFSSEDRTLWLYPEKEEPYVASEHIEVWEATDWEETDTQIIIELTVVETTYFEEGRVFKLIHNK